MKMKIKNNCNMITITRFYVLRDGRNRPPPPQLPKYLTIPSAWKNSPSVESPPHQVFTLQRKVNSFHQITFSTLKPSKIFTSLLLYHFYFHLILLVHTF